MARKQVHPDQRFDRLVVIRETETRKGKRYALCRCECGTVREFDIYGLLSGHTRSCGCLAREKLELGRQAANLTDQTFGRLTARHQDGLRNGSVVWVCECECGNVVAVPARDLVSGNTTSCGCAVKDFAKSLKQHNEQHHTIDGVFAPLLRQKIQTNNKTGVKGVSIQRDKKGRVKYVANITVNGKRIYLGIYPTIEQAAEARKRAEEQCYTPYLERYEEEKKRDKRRN